MPQLEPLRHDLWDPLKRTQDPPPAAHRMRCGSQCGGKRALSSVRVSTRYHGCAGSGRAERNSARKKNNKHRSGARTNGSRRHGNSSAHGLLNRGNSAKTRYPPSALALRRCLLPESKGRRFPTRTSLLSFTLLAICGLGANETRCYRNSA